MVINKIGIIKDLDIMKINIMIILLGKEII